MPQTFSVLVAATILLGGCGATSGRGPEGAPDGVSDGICHGAPSQVELDRLADHVAALLEADETGEALPRLEPSGCFVIGDMPVYVALRRLGLLLAESWSTEGSWLSAFERAFAEAKGRLHSSQRFDAVEVTFSHSPRLLGLGDHPARGRLLSNAQRGVRSLELTWGEEVSFLAATSVVALNRSYERHLELYRTRHGWSDEKLAEEVGSRVYESVQVLVRLGENPTATLMERGNSLVPISAVDREAVTSAKELAARWMWTNLDGDGRMTYKLWPSRGLESDADNAIRQWMATLVLEDLAEEAEDPALWTRVAGNIDYNLGKFYREESNLGLIEWRDRVKLGGVALAALALLRHPERERWSEQEAALRRTLLDLWNDDGSFTTFYKPRGRADGQNFYPGETLLFWSELYLREGDEELRERFFRSFAYYRDWHRANRNPAFVPWHTQAGYRMWLATGDAALASFILEMNDWLLPVQQRGNQVPYPDLAGRFYDPTRPFGPPHASSTGVYLEGLTDAFRLAREMGDRARAESYRQAIVRGLRSVLQLQFADDVDLFYVAGPARRRDIEGGLRTTVYDNEVRVDNIQHPLGAMVEILRVFESADFRLDVAVTTAAPSM